MEKDVVRRGYLKITGSKGLIGSLSRFGSKKSWVVLFRESIGYKARIEVFKDEDDFMTHKPSKVLSIEHLSNVTNVPEKKEIVLSFDSESIIFTCSSRADVDDWIQDIQCLKMNGYGVDKKKHGEDRSAMNASYPEDEYFRVKLRQSSTLLFHGSCILEIQRDFERNLFHLALFSDDEIRRAIVKWQIDHIRQYGSNDVAFKFQSGSKSSTGVDWFILETEPGQAPRIHGAVDYWARHIVEQATNMMPNTRTSLPRAIPPIPPIQTRPRPSLTPSSPLPSIPNTSNNTSYEPINFETRSQTQSVYEDLNKIPAVPRGGNRPASMATSLPDQPYQALIPARNNNTSIYTGINEVTRDRSISVTGTTTVPNGTSQEYMRINQATRNTQDPLYMGVP